MLEVYYVVSLALPINNTRQVRWSACAECRFTLAFTGTLVSNLSFVLLVVRVSSTLDETN